MWSSYIHIYLRLDRAYPCLREEFRRANACVLVLRYAANLILTVTVRCVIARMPGNSRKIWRAVAHLLRRAECVPSAWNRCVKTLCYEFIIADTLRQKKLNEQPCQPFPRV